MGTPVDSGQSIANDALYMTMAASVVIPAGWELASMMFKDGCDTGGIYAAGEAWLKVAQDLADARTAAESVRSAAAACWEGEDERSYDEKARTFEAELLGQEILATMVGVAMITMAVLTFARILFMMALAVIMDIWEGLIIAAAASIIGDLGASEALEASADEFAVSAVEMLTTFDEAVAAVELACVADIAGCIGGDVVGSLALGDTKALGNLGQATVDGIGTIASGLVARVFRDAVAKGIKLPFGNAGEALPGMKNLGNLLGKAVGVTDTATGQTPLDPVERWLASV